MKVPILKTEIKPPKFSASKKMQKISKSLYTDIEDNGADIAAIKKLLSSEIGKEAFNYLDKNVNLSDKITVLQSTSTRFNIEKISDKKYTNIVNITRVNDIRWLNKFFETVNSKLPHYGLFIGCVETKKERKKKDINYTIIED